MPPANAAAVSAMITYGWEVTRAEDEYVPSMEFSTEGPYAIYRETVAHWQRSGFDVLAEAQAGRER